MDQNRWKTVNRIFHAALEVDPGQRSSLVAMESYGDLELQAEVELLLQADADVGSYLESPLIPAEFLSPFASPLVPGDVLCGRFRIIRAIAEGGMGHVFEALDSELAVHVALKVIRPEIASNPDAIARFRQEVRLARSITHPNICRTFDIERELRVSNGQRTELVFLTMEFLPGETLATRIKRSGPLPLSDTLRLARQIGDALHAAHTLGVIHRDMKPANIMLVAHEVSTQEGPRAVVTDFGLARLNPLLVVEGLSSFTNTAHPIGTLAYMAPEQLDGTAVSPATDIYAFGLILFEMVTGKRAFHSNNLLSGIAQRLRGSLRLELLLAPEIPANWRHALEDCLYINPSDRPQDANDVIAMLEDDRRRVFPRLRRSDITSRQLLLSVSAIIAAFLVAMALFIGSLRLYQSRTDSKVNPGALVYLTQVKNQTGEKSFDTLTELIQAGLSQSIQVNLLDQGRVGDILQQMTKDPESAVDAATAREIAMRAGAARVIFATIKGSRGGYSLDLDVQQPDNTPVRYREHWTRSFEWHSPDAIGTMGMIPPELLATMRQATDWLRHEAGESANDIARLNSPPEDVTTGHWSALAAYSSAEDLYTRGRKEDALVAFQNAVRTDPQFALAYARMGDITVSLGRTQEGYRAYARALDTDFDQRLTRRELDRIRGIFASDSWDYRAAESAFHDYTVYYEYDYTGWFFRALPLVRLGRVQEAIATLKKAFAVDPSRPNAPYDLATCYIELGDIASARQWIEVLRRSHFEEGAAQLEGMVAFLYGLNDEAETKFTSLRSSPSPLFRIRAFSFLTRLEAERGDYRRALAWTDAGMAEGAAEGNEAWHGAFLMDRAYVHCHLEEYVSCLEEATQSLSLDTSPELLISASQLYGQAIPKTSGSISANFRRALSALSRKIPSDIQNTAYTLTSLRIRTEELMADGKWNEALAEARRVANLDTQFKRRDYLGRALEMAAHKNTDFRKRRALMTEAREEFGKSALHPSVVWVQSSLYPPGTSAEDLGTYLRVSNELEADDADTHLGQNLLAKMRDQDVLVTR